jgi:hypothetical protein
MFASDAFSECALTALPALGWARIRKHDVLCDSRQSRTSGGADVAGEGQPPLGLVFLARRLAGKPKL